MHTGRPRHTHTHTHACGRTVLRHTDKKTQKRVLIIHNVHMHMRADRHTDRHIRAGTQHTDMHTCMHAHTHTHTHTHVHTERKKDKMSSLLPHYDIH